MTAHPQRPTQPADAIVEALNAIASAIDAIHETLRTVVGTAPEPVTHTPADRDHEES